MLRWSDATYLEDQDMWRLSGLHRDVLLLTKPASAAIVDYAVRTPLAWAAAAGGSGTASSGEGGGGGAPLSEARLEIDVRLEASESDLISGGGAAPRAPGSEAAADALRGLSVTAQLYDSAGRPVNGAPLECALEQVGLGPARGQRAVGSVRWCGCMTQRGGL